MSNIRDVLNSLPDTQIIETSRTTAVTSGVGVWIASMAEWNWTAIIGATVAVLTLAINWFFSHRKHRLNKAESALRQSLLQAQIDSLKGKCNVDLDEV